MGQQLDCAFTKCAAATGPAAILVVEDELMISIELATLINERGGKAIGPFASVDAAKAAIATTRIDGAILDLDLNGVTSFELLDLLEAAHVPFVVYTGIDRCFISTAPSNISLLLKPCNCADVVDHLLATLEK